MKQLLFGNMEWMSHPYSYYDIWHFHKNVVQKFFVNEILLWQKCAYWSRKRLVVLNQILSPLNFVTASVAVRAIVELVG